MKKYKGYTLSNGMGFGRIVLAENIQDFSSELITQDTILCVHEINIRIAMECIKKKVSGVVVEKGGYTSHGCILLRSQKIPCILINNIMQEVNESGNAIIDGNMGVLILNNEY